MARSGIFYELARGFASAMLNVSWYTKSDLYQILRGSYAIRKNEKDMSLTAFFLFDLEEITFRLQTRHIQIAIKVRDLRSCRYLSNYISIIRFAPNDRWHDANAFFFR